MDGVLIEVGHLEEIKKKVRNVYDRFVLSLLDEEYSDEIKMVEIEVEKGKSVLYRRYRNESLNIVRKLIDRNVLKVDKVMFCITEKIC